MPNKTETKTGKKRVYCDISKCLGCRSCEIACAVEHSKSKNLFQAINEMPLPEKRVSVEPLSLTDITHDTLHIKHSLPLHCRHCEDAPCVKICPAKSMQKLDEGPVVHKDETCIGCKWCILVCPFGIPKVGRSGKVIIKCDHCIERYKKGIIPACVEACPTKAVRIVVEEEINANKKKKFLVEIVKAGKELGI